jgi:glutathione S-transferase
MRLYIGNKNYSSWSMRPWVLMKYFEIDFEEIKFRLNGFTPDSQFKIDISRISPAGRVPVLVDEDFAVWDTLAILEYLVEKFPNLPLWPVDGKQRARARSVCCEMHAGFSALRRHFPMNIEASLPEVGKRVMREHSDVRADVERIVQMWGDLLSASGGFMLFGDFSIADAYFAPIVMRLITYCVSVPAEITDYMNRVRSLPAIGTWISQALAEHDFIMVEEPYRCLDRKTAVIG